MVIRISMTVMILNMIFVLVIMNCVWADDASQVDVKISYPCIQGQIVCDTDYAVVRNAPDVGDIVNIYITLLDMNGCPATACPGGEAFDNCEINITSELGAIVQPNTFLSASNTVMFDTPPGPSARAYVDYTNTQLDTPFAVDTITVAFPKYPAIYDTAHVNVTTSASPTVIDEPKGEATALMVLGEGPQTESGIVSPGGQSIFRISANGTGTINRTIQVDIFSRAIWPKPELRLLDGTVLDLPYIITLTFVPKLQDIRLVFVGNFLLDMLIVTDLSDKPLVPAESGYAPHFSTVSIFPDISIVHPNEAINFTARTESGCTYYQGEYTWEVSESNCLIKGTVDQNGLYTAPDAGACTETVRVIDKAHGGNSAEATVNVCGKIAVTVTPASSALSDGASEHFYAKTTCDGTEVLGSYTWELEGQEVGTGNEYIFTCNENNVGMGKILKVTDITNGVSAEAIIFCESSGCNVVQDQIVRSRWIPLPAILTIETTCTDMPLFGCTIDISCESEFSIIRAGRLIFTNTQTIPLVILVMPSFGLRAKCVTCTVKFIGCDCDDTCTFEMCTLPFFLDLQM